MAEKNKQTLTVRYNAADYSAKNECLYSDFGDLLTLQEKNGVKTSDMYHNERALLILLTLQLNPFVQNDQKILKNVTISLY